MFPLFDLPLLQLAGLAQVQEEATGNGLSFGSSFGVPGLGAPLLMALYFIVGLAILVGIFFILRAVLRHVSERNASFNQVLLMVLVPKQVKKENEQTNNINAVREKIATAETFFTSIGALKAQKHLGAWLLGRDDQFAFEIVAKDGVITFYAACPKKFQQFIEQQIVAQWPDAQLEEVTDYNIFSKTGTIYSAYLKFARADAYPLKTFKTLDADPLSGLTNSMSKVTAEDGAAIQFIVRSARKKWRAKGLQMAKEMQKGKKPKEGEPQVQLTPMEQDTIKAIQEKAGKAGVDVNVRVIVSSEDETRAKLNLENILGSFGQFNLYQTGNTLKSHVPSRSAHLIRDFVYRAFNEKQKNILNTEEIASMFHFPLPSTETPNIRWLMARKAPAPVNTPTTGVIIGHSMYRGTDTIIRMLPQDRRRHFYVIGKSGSGKTTVLKQMAIQDIENGQGVCVVDPHGDFVEDVLANIPKERVDDVIVFDPSDVERPVGLNMLEAKNPDQRDFLVQEMISVFYKLFPPEMMGPMFEHNMRNVMLTLMSDTDNPGTLAEIPRMFSDTDFQNQWVAKVTDPVVRAFWEKEMAKTSDFHKSEMLGYLISKVGRFVENEMMRNIIGQARSGFDLREIMDTKKILLVNLAKGKVGEVNANLLGLIIVSKLQMAAFTRAELPEEERHDFFLYIDEFQNFITPSIATILSEARKYRLNLQIAHQYMAQLVDKGDASIRDAVLGNVGTMAIFRIGVEDAEILAKEFAPTFGAYDLVNVEARTAFVKLLIDSTAAVPFTMQTYPPRHGNRELAEAIKELSRLKYGRHKKLVEMEILERTQLGETAPEPEAVPPSL
ncbi:MAG: hypothetical protein HW383_386 [Candidatus Magasanikbacteria bacterium]|nr:hypothetical protein [Candidatus Magasanikbacteria bacterium]